MKKIIFSTLLILLILTTLPITALAHDIPNVTRQDCTIDVVLWDKKNDKAIVGAELVCYRVGYVDHDEDNNYHFYDILTNEQIPDSDINSGTTAAEFEYYAKKNLYKDYEYKEKFEKEGVYYFTELPTGLYVVIQTKAANGYSDMNAFLVSVPYMDNGKYIYDVTANVKTELKQNIETVPPTSKPSYGNKLPQTGQLTWPIPWMASSGMVLFAFGWWLCFGRRKDSYED